MTVKAFLKANLLKILIRRLEQFLPPLLYQEMSVIIIKDIFFILLEELYRVLLFLKGLLEYLIARRFLFLK